MNKSPGHIDVFGFRTLCEQSVLITGSVAILDLTYGGEGVGNEIFMI